MYLPPFGSGYLATSSVSITGFLAACAGSALVALLGPLVLWMCVDWDASTCVGDCTDSDASSEACGATLERLGDL